MIRDDLAHQSKTKPGAVFSARDEGIKDITLDLFWQTGAIVDDLDLKRQFLGRAIGATHPETVLKEGVEADRSALLGIGGFGRVLEQVQHHLQKLVGITIRHGQRGIVILDDLHVRPNAKLGRAARPVQHVMDINRPHLGNREIAELFDLLQQLHDAAGFGHDQVG